MDDFPADGYKTPEEAARGDIPERFAQPLSVEISPHGREALVVLATNEEPYTELYEVVCDRECDRWFTGIDSGGIGSGWTSTSISEDGTNLGVLRLADEVPPGVTAVIVKWDGEEHRVAVSGGYFFFTRWDVPSDFDKTAGAPEDVLYVRKDGSGDPVLVNPLVRRAWERMREWQEPRDWGF